MRGFTNKVKYLYWKSREARIRKPKILKNVFFDITPNENILFIAGTGRSGTTWLEEVINYKHDHRIIFEPFHRDKVSLCKHFHRRQYLRHTNKAAEFIEPIKSILNGKLRNTWTDQYNDRWIYRYRMIKAVRANLILYWLHRNFTNISIILLLRHPCAVALSWLQLGWKPPIQDCLNQPGLVEDFLAPFIEEIERRQNNFDRIILQWCIDNYIPLKQFQAGNLHLVFYENLVRSPESEIDRLSKFLKRPINLDVLNKISRPSAQARTDSAISSGLDLLEQWRKDISPDQLQRACKLLGLFGLDKIYNDSLVPDQKVAEDLLKENTLFVKAAKVA